MFHTYIIFEKQCVLSRVVKRTSLLFINCWNPHINIKGREIVRDELPRMNTSLVQVIRLLFRWAFTALLNFGQVRPFIGVLDRCDFATI